MERRIAAWENTLIIDQGCAWVFGDNSAGQLGLGNKKLRIKKPKRLEHTSAIVSVACGTSHSLFLDERGVVWGSGCNLRGQLGLGRSVTTITKLERIRKLPKIVAIASGDMHSLFLDAKGSVWGTGMTEYTYYTDEAIPKRPIKIDIFDKKIKAIYAHGKASLMIDIDGIAWHLGNLNHTQAVAFQCEGKIEQIERHHLLTDLGEVFAFTLKPPGLLGKENVPPIVTIACGHSHSLFLDTEGKVWGLGNNFNGELGVGHGSRKEPCLIENIPLIKFIGCGQFHSVLIDIQGQVWSCGLNKSRQLGYDFKIPYPLLNKRQRTMKAIDTIYSEVKAHQGIKSARKDLCSSNN